MAEWGGGGICFLEFGFDFYVTMLSKFAPNSVHASLPTPSPPPPPSPKQKEMAVQRKSEDRCPWVFPIMNMPIEENKARPKTQERGEAAGGRGKRQKAENGLWDFKTGVFQAETDQNKATNLG